ncbi:NifU-like protein [Actinomadura pelletieri DSM 43383]|uniref:NifU-like protein n=1 Tax=Actinomadura pelletieri DSM 43383 TaxID=1120940 RepID=A0A495QX68_9ACTN|nr:NifU family protein [Actinomadura pelletieri]RKS78789.1 NifU-like protein [Actinomadura pelletieri DSM 43383]
MADPASGPGARRLDGAAIAGRLDRLDETLGLLERTPGATAETALDAVTLLTEVYGEALARVMDRVSGDTRLVEAFLDDELVGHLFVLHGVHPEPVEGRVARALEALRPQLGRKGVDAEIVEIRERTAEVRLTGGTGGGCGCGAEPVEDVVREAVLAVAPELDGVRVTVPDAPAAAKAFVPVEALLRPPISVDGGP